MPDFPVLPVDQTGISPVPVLGSPPTVDTRCAVADLNSLSVYPGRPSSRACCLAQRRAIPYMEAHPAHVMAVMGRQMDRKRRIPSLRTTQSEPSVPSSSQRSTPLLRKV